MDTVVTFMKSISEYAVLFENKASNRADRLQ